MIRRSLFLADEAVADHHDPFGGGPAVLAVAHAAAAGVRMDGLGPLAGGRGEAGDGFHEVAVARVAGAEQRLGDVERQVGVDARVDHVLKEAAAEEAAAAAGLRPWP